MTVKFESTVEGSNFKVGVPIKLRPEICATCKYCVQRYEGSELVLVCVHKSPVASKEEGLAVWPIVELNDWCRKHSYDSKYTDN